MPMHVIFKRNYFFVFKRNMKIQIFFIIILQAQYRMQYPHLTEDQLNQATRAYMMQIQSGFTGRTNAYDKSFYQQVS